MVEFLNMRKNEDRGGSGSGVNGVTGVLRKAKIRKEKKKRKRRGGGGGGGTGGAACPPKIMLKPSIIYECDPCTKIYEYRQRIFGWRRRRKTYLLSCYKTPWERDALLPDMLSHVTLQIWKNPLNSENIGAPRKLEAKTPRSQCRQ